MPRRSICSRCDISDPPGQKNGGTSTDLTTGVNYGINFGANAVAICLNTIGTTCTNTSRGGLGDPTADKGALVFQSGTESFKNVADGFDTGFSFFYTAINQGGSISVFDGLNGAGDPLATLTLPTTTSARDAVYNAAPAMPSTTPGFARSWPPHRLRRRGQPSGV